MSRGHHHIAGARWQATRRAAFERDGYRCRQCGRAGRLEAHHEPPLKDGMDPFDVAGIKTLCRGCHIERHRGERRRKPTGQETAWRALVAEMMPAAPDNICGVAWDGVAPGIGTINRRLNQ